MPLLKAWAPYFKTDARQQGRAHYQEGRVQRLEPKPGQIVRAQVTDTTPQSHTVALSYEDPVGTSASCTCNQVDGGVFCEHVWATLMAIQHNDAESGYEAPLSDLAQPCPPRARKRRPDQARVNQTQPQWSTRLDLLRPTRSEADAPPSPIEAYRQISYCVCPTLSIQHGALVVRLQHSLLTASGYSPPKPFKINRKNLHEIPDPLDRELCAVLLGAVVTENQEDPPDRLLRDRPAATFILPEASQRRLLIRLIQTGKTWIEPKGRQTTPIDPYQPLTWDGDLPWVLWLVGQWENQQLCVGLELRRGQDRLPIDQPTLILGGLGGLIIHHNQVAPFDDWGAYRWVSQFRDPVWWEQGSTMIRVPAEDTPRFLDRLYLLPQLPKLDLPPDVARSEACLCPVPHVELHRPNPDSPTGQTSTPRNALLAHVWFAYGQQNVKPGQAGWFVTSDPSPPVDEQPQPHHNAPDHERQPILIHRDLQFEADAIASLWPLGFRPYDNAHPHTATLLLPTAAMPDAVEQLLTRAWHVTADQKAIRSPSTPTLSVTTGIDWFELRGGVRYQTQEGYQDVSLPAILAAVRAGEQTITLGDGSQGMLPQQWLDQQGLLDAIGQTHDDHLRFKSTQAMILDSLLSQQSRVGVDAKFEDLRRRLHGFQGVHAIDPPPTFQGTLRPYQGQGLGWLEYLRLLSIGGILADDMGLGKTVQVLAMLDRIYNNPPDPDRPLLQTDPTHPQPPSLIVVPRSIVFNWVEEAHRFAPKLKIHAFTGADRHTQANAFEENHVIVTSYGLMRRDIAQLTNRQFEYAVLDEAQAIKNPTSQSAKAARLLNATHRLALTGTPIENHLGDLWSIFEFLNPGMLGTNTRFARLIRSVTQSQRGRTNLSLPSPLPTQGPTRANPDPPGIVQIAKALQPFILRRTKQQVLDDLPEKTEQTILCEMEPRQREIYDQLLQHYRGRLLRQRTSSTNQAGQGFRGSTMMVLEALLRLRQAACHPGLIDPQQADEPAAKMQVLMDRIHDLIDEGHKALVFSQFTSMLSLVRKPLDQQGIAYEYLDGQTRNRAKAVERFQNDPGCPLFLISLKAGGLGLNLTAAGYVFILDPWWNPAVEAQAIDRAHRIGQTRRVFAYRLICQDTVEQRIAQLQTRKRKLADAIVGNQENLLRTLTHEDLQYLLT